MHILRAGAAASRAALKVQRGAAVHQPCRTQQRCESVVGHDSKDGKQSQNVDDVLAAANALLENLSAGQTPVVQPPLQANIDELQELGYVCDESGCVLVLPGDSERRGSLVAPAVSRLLSGSNWSLGTPSRSSSEADEGEAESSLTAVVSGPSWSVALHPSELAVFLSSLKQLRLMVDNLAGRGQWYAGGADKPASRCKWERGNIVVQACYAPGTPGFSIETTFKADRHAVTTHWPADVVAEVLAEIDNEANANSSSSNSSENGSASTTEVRSTAAVSA